MLEYVTKLPTAGEIHPPVGSMHPMGVSLESEPYLIKREKLQDMDMEDNNKLILLLRNYKDVFTAHKIGQGISPPDIRGASFESSRRQHRSGRVPKR